MRGIEQYDVRSLLVSLEVLSTDAATEVVLWPDIIVVESGVTLWTHMLFSHAPSLAGR